MIIIQAEDREKYKELVTMDETLYSAVTDFKDCLKMDKVFTIVQGSSKSLVKMKDPVYFDSNGNICIIDRAYYKLSNMGFYRGMVHYGRRSTWRRAGMAYILDLPTKTNFIDSLASLASKNSRFLELSNVLSDFHNLRNELATPLKSEYSLVLPSPEIFYMGLSLYTTQTEEKIIAINGTAEYNREGFVLRFELKASDTMLYRVRPTVEDFMRLGNLYTPLLEVQKVILGKIRDEIVIRKNKIEVVFQKYAQYLVLKDL